MHDENRDNNMSNILTRKLVAIAFCVGLVFPPLVNAADEEFLCEARQNSKTELPVLSADCPIGNGIWGASPQVDDGLFWIQCGLFKEAQTIKQVQPIYNVISTDVWVKAEEKGYRCLIGPYEKYSAANTDLLNLKKLRSYKDSFIRNATSGDSAALAKPKANKPAKKPAKKSPKKAPKVKSNAAAAAVTAGATSTEPKVMSPKKEIVAEKKGKSEETVVARRDVKIGDKYYVIPFLMDGYDQFYMEYGIAWNRLNYERAMEVCQSQKMNLPSAEEWKMLIDSQVMSKKQWPLHLPYWGQDKQGLFTSGKVTQLTGTSLLNVVCVK